MFYISGDQGGRVISCLKFTNRPAWDGVSPASQANVIVCENGSNFTLDLIDFDSVPEGIYMSNCDNVTIKRIRARDIFGPFTRNGFHSGNLIQFGGGSTNVQISDLKVDQPSTVPTKWAGLIHPSTGQSSYGTEDIISIGGASGVTISRFAFYGGAWRSWSGTGMFVGDGGGAGSITVRDGVLYQPGQVGIGTSSAGGPFQLTNIDIYSPQVCCFTGLNGVQYGSTAALQVRNTATTTLTDVRVDWVNSGGTHSGITFTQAERDAIRALTRVQ